MTNKELANLIFPNIDKTLEDYKEMYPRREGDFAVTRFMDSSGIGLIMGRYKKITCFGGKVFVLHPDKQIKRMLLMAGMQNLVEIVE